MITFLYGPDDYRRQRRKNELIADFMETHSELGFGLFDGEAAAALDALTEFARSQSIFESEKFAVLENAFAIESEKLAKVLAPIASVKDTTLLISERDKPVKALAFLLRVPTCAEYFDNLDGSNWTSFVKAEAKKIGLALADDAVQFLGAVYQGNSWALVTELQKLAAFKASIRKSDLDILDLEIAPNYWALMNSLKSFDARIRLYALEKLLIANDPPPKIFNILAAQAGEKTPRMAEYDFAVKSGKLDYEEALLDLALA